IGWLAWMYGGIKNFFISKELWQLIVSGLSVKMLGDVVDMYKPYFFIDQITFFVAVRAPYTKYITVASQEALLLETMDLGTSYKKTKQMLINDLSMIVMSVEQLLMFMLYENKKNAMQSQVLDDMSNYLKNSLDTWTDAIEKELQAFPFPSARVVTLLQELKIDIDHVIAQILDLQRMKKIQKARKIST
ncbi:MAG TPA: hypothetical protein VEK38_00435, partial [Candidatus Bathyarchaeia archaeon]|nr:hypothetical protein [Candidatus Bathyarchaeia archaeon]